ncbi:MAG TPA: histidine phosphatase family protein [Gemmatimonadales bacterium]|nr:histidine phosphatase family protein [Gemmatimonadales bacterium]
MARQLWLLRHAEAEPHGTREDSARRLTERGERQSRAAGRALLALGVSFEEVLYSPKARARETAELALEEWDPQLRARARSHEPLAGGFDAAKAREAIAALPADGRLLVVGHEPDLSGVVGELTGARVDFKKGGVAAVRLEGAGGELTVLLRPRELALIADAQGVPAGAGLRGLDGPGGR